MHRTLVFLPETVWPLPTKQSRSSDPAVIEALGHMMQPTIFALQHIRHSHWYMLTHRLLKRWCHSVHNSYSYHNCYGNAKSRVKHVTFVLTNYTTTACSLLTWVLSLINRTRRVWLKDPYHLL